MVTWAVAPVLFFSFSDSKLPHYILPVYSPLSILAGKSLCRILRDRSGKMSWVFSLPWLTLAAALLVVVLASLGPDVLPNHVRKPICQFAPMIPLTFVWTILLILIALAFADWTKLWKRPGALYLSYCLGLALMAFFTHLVVATVSHSRTSKELAKKAEPFIHPQDQIVIYNAYLSSLPFYLRVSRPLWVVWSGKKNRVMGSAYVAEKLPRSALDHGEVVFTYEQFPKLWRESHERLLVFTRTKDVDRLSEQGVVAIKTLLREGDVILVTNR
jgi:4-amino-4-deoxy-L-arabinose transferase-like glycosyltransferase